MEQAREQVEAYFSDVHSDGYAVWFEAAGELRIFAGKNKCWHLAWEFKQAHQEEVRQLRRDVAYFTFEAAAHLGWCSRYGDVSSTQDLVTVCRTLAMLESELAKLLKGVHQ